MTNIVEASNVAKEVQVMSGSKSKSPKGNFATLFKSETETLKMDMAEEGGAITKTTVIEVEEKAQEPIQELTKTDKDIDENDGAINPLAYLIQGSPPRQIKSSVPSLKPLVATEPVVTRLTPAGSLGFQEPPAVQAIKGTVEEQELAKVDEIGAFKVETPAPENLPKILPGEVEEAVTNAIPGDLIETNLEDVLPELQSKKEAFMASENQVELEKQKTEERILGSKAVPKPVVSLEESNISFPSGEAKEKEASGDAQKKAQADSTLNFSSAVKANGLHKLQIASTPEETGVENKNFEVMTREILHQMETLTDGNKTMIRVKLHPEEMGEMEISLSMEEGRLTGKIVVGNREIQQIFTEKLHELNQSLKENRIDVASFEVKISPDQNQNQDQSRQQGRRPMDYFDRFKNHRNDSTQTEEWMRPESTANRGIDLLA